MAGGRGKKGRRNIRAKLLGNNGVGNLGTKRCKEGKKK